MAITYYEIGADGTEKKMEHMACFAPLGREPNTYRDCPLPHAVRYEARVGDSLTDNEVKAYVSFLIALFDNTTTNMFGVEIKKRTVTWTLKTPGLHRIKALVYLTAFRYTDELSKLIKDWMAYAHLDLEGQLTGFQAVHVADMVGRPVGTYGLLAGMGGHALMMPREHPGVDVQTFRARLLDPNVLGVFSHFAPCAPRVKEKT